MIVVVVVGGGGVLVLVFVLVLVSVLVRVLVIALVLVLVLGLVLGLVLVLVIELARDPGASFASRSVMRRLRSSISPLTGSMDSVTAVFTNPFVSVTRLSCIRSMSDFVTVVAVKLFT